MENEHHGEGGVHHKPKQITVRLNKKTAYIIVAVVALGVLGFYYKGSFVAGSVDGKLISRFAVIRELEAVSGKQAFDSLVVQKLIRAEAKQKGVTATDEEINAEIAKIEEQMKAQGGTLEQALSTQGMALETLKKQLRTQKLLEKLVSGTTQVSDQEEAQYNELAKNQLIQQKLNNAKTAYVNDLKAKAKIRTFMTY